MYFYDTETVGLYGAPVLIQYANGTEGSVHVLDMWRSPVKETLDLIDMLMVEGVCAWNMVFDHFHLCKIYNIFTILAQKYGNDYVPIVTDLNELADIEIEAMDLGTLRPAECVDLMLHAQKDTYQKCMNRTPIEIKRVAGAIVPEVLRLLEGWFEYEPILYANKAKQEGYWSVEQSTNKEGEPVEGMYNLKCSLRPSLALKEIVKDMGLVDEVDKFEDAGAPITMRPLELGFAPYARALENVTPAQRVTVDKYLVKMANQAALEKWNLPFNGSWVHFLSAQVNFWATNKRARKYAENDVIYLQEIFKRWNPPISDDDSVLATCVAACRWKGFKIDPEGLKSLETDDRKKMEAFPQYSSPNKSLAYITDAMDPIDKASFGRKTGKFILEPLALRGGEVGRRAQGILDARSAKKELELIDKLLIAGRFHASLKIIGALSSRMSGSNGLNPQGIKRDAHIRTKFPLAFDGFQLCGGDFASFEVTIFEAVSGDAKLRADLLKTYPCTKCGGVGCDDEDCINGETPCKIHALFGTFVYPDMTYEEILKDKQKYTRSKSALFAMLYGGEAQTLKTRLGVPLEVAQAAYDKFMKTYIGAYNERIAIKARFSPLKQLHDGGPITWTEHDNYVESLYGFRRYFRLAFKNARDVFDLANMVPPSITRLDLKVCRYPDAEIPRIQTVGGAFMTALYGAAFGIQGAVFRQAANHRIQSTGAQITKRLERNIWELQPIGFSSWKVQPLNIHDEIMCPAEPSMVPAIREVVEKLVEEVRPVVPLVGIDWADSLKNWGEK